MKKMALMWIVLIFCSLVISLQACNRHPEITPEVIDQTIVGKTVGEGFSAWRFQPDEPRTISILEQQVDGNKVVAVVQIETQNGPSKASGQLRLYYDLAGKEWRLQKIDNLSFNLVQPRQEKINTPLIPSVETPAIVIEEERPVKISPTLLTDLKNFPPSRIYGRELRTHEINKVYCKKIIASFIQADEYDYGNFLIRASHFSTESGAYQWYNRSECRDKCCHFEELHPYGFYTKMVYHTCEGCKNCSHLIFVYKGNMTIEIYPHVKKVDRNKEKALEILKSMMGGTFIPL